MKIAQIAPLFERVPPIAYGGTERVVSILTEELVRLGHDVTLFASGDSQTSARLVALSDRSLRTDSTCLDPLAHHVLLIERVADMAAEFDILHFHIDYLHFSLTRRLGVPYLTTLHGRLDLPDLKPLYTEFDDVPLVSISDSQRGPLPWVNWIGTVHHGLPVDMYPAGPGGGGYLAFLGRISPEKGVEQAIEIARRSEVPLRIAAKIDRVDREYFEHSVRHLLDPAFVEYLGEITDAEKRSFLGDAEALLFPIDWEEPFGVVLIEALACATPVIAFNRGSVPEVVRSGVNGAIVKDVDQAVKAVWNISRMSRARCRADFERRFSAQRMAEDYLRLYRALTSDDQPQQSSSAHEVTFG